MNPQNKSHQGTLTKTAVLKCPKKIIIMADYSSVAYAWDFKTRVMIAPIKDYFPNDPQIAAIDRGLLKWCDWFDRNVDPIKDNTQFPWKDFHKQGITMAKKLARIVNKNGVEIYYQLPFEDPKGKGSKPKKIVG
jgi:hypothetical protein